MQPKQQSELEKSFGDLVREGAVIKVNGARIATPAAFIAALRLLDDAFSRSLVSDMDGVVQQIGFRRLPTTWIPRGEGKRPTVDITAENFGALGSTLEAVWNH